MPNARDSKLKSFALAALLAAIVIGIVLCATLYFYIISGGATARGRIPPALELSVAQWLLRESVPASIRRQKNPLNSAPDSSDVRAGRELYRQKCEICHAYDGGGKTEIGGGQYPAPPNLGSASIQGLSDGELKHHIEHGIRNTGMPGWGMPDQHLWRQRRKDHRPR